MAQRVKNPASIVTAVVQVTAGAQVQSLPLKIPHAVDAAKKKGSDYLPFGPSQRTECGRSLDLSVFCSFIFWSF